MKFKFLQLKFFLKLIGKWKGWQSKLLTAFLVILVAASCEVDDFSEDVPTGESNNPPSIEITSPAANETLLPFKEMSFSLSIADQDIGLSRAFLSLIDSTGGVVVSEEIVLTGTEDDFDWVVAPNTIVLPGNSFLEGAFTLEIQVSDTEGKFSVLTRSLNLRGPVSNQPMMNMAGSFNGWSNSETSMMLVDDYVWATVDSVTLAGGDEFLFIADPSFDPKFGDGNCDDIAELGGNNTACMFSGTFVVYFNDETLEYNLEGILNLLTNNSEIFILGSMNGWGGTDLQMELVENYTWRLGGVVITASDEFKFANTSDFSGSDWGDAECDGISNQGGANIACGYDGTYEVVFNDETLEYTVIPDFERNEDEMYILGSMNGWGGTLYQMTLVDNNTWQVDNVVITSSDEFKFANTSNFSNTDWGDAGCDGVAETPGDNIACGFDGTFTVVFNDETLEYSFN